MAAFAVMALSLLSRAVMTEAGNGSFLLRLSRYIPDAGHACTPHTPSLPVSMPGHVDWGSERWEDACPDCELCHCGW